MSITVAIKPRNISNMFLQLKLKYIFFMKNLYRTWKHLKSFYLKSFHHQSLPRIFPICHGDSHCCQLRKHKTITCEKGANVCFPCWQQCTLFALGYYLWLFTALTNRFWSYWHREGCKTWCKCVDVSKKLWNMKLLISGFDEKVKKIRLCPMVSFAYRTILFYI